MPTSTPVDAGAINTNVLLADVTYGLTDKIAVDLALPLVTSKYTGNRPHAGTNIDDGTYRSTFTDVRFALRYNLTRDSAVITPYIGTMCRAIAMRSMGTQRRGSGCASCRSALCRETLRSRPARTVHLRPLRLWVRREGARHLPQPQHGRPRGGLLLHCDIPRLHDDQRGVHARRRRLSTERAWRAAARASSGSRSDPEGSPPRRGRGRVVLDQ